MSTLAFSIHLGALLTTAWFLNSISGCGLSDQHKISCWFRWPAIPCAYIDLLLGIAMQRDRPSTTLKLSSLTMNTRTISTTTKTRQFSSLFSTQDLNSTFILGGKDAQNSSMLWSLRPAISSSRLTTLSWFTMKSLHTSHKVYDWIWAS